MVSLPEAQKKKNNQDFMLEPFFSLFVLVAVARKNLPLHMLVAELSLRLTVRGLNVFAERLGTKIGGGGLGMKNGAAAAVQDLGGGFKHFLFSPLLGEDSYVDEHIFQMGRINHQLEDVLS